VRVRCAFLFVLPLGVKEPCPIDLWTRRTDKLTPASATSVLDRNLRVPEVFVTTAVRNWHRSVIQRSSQKAFSFCYSWMDRLCGLVVRVLGDRSGGPGSIPGTTKKKVVGPERGPLSLVSTIEELLDRKIAAPV
jgi:hypothetical protein